MVEIIKRTSYGYASAVQNKRDTLCIKNFFSKRALLYEYKEKTIKNKKVLKNNRIPYIFVEFDIVFLLVIIYN